MSERAERKAAAEEREWRNERYAPMTRDEARAVVGELVQRLAGYYYDAPQLDAALDEFELAVKAEMPCFYQFTIDGLEKDCTGVGPDFERHFKPCPSCQAREERSR